MKNLKEINKELMEVLTEKATNLDEFEGTPTGERFYRSITGWYEDRYFSVTLMSGSVTSQKIMIAHTTEHPQDLIDIIKAIEPDQPINYTEVETVITHIEKTI